MILLDYNIPKDQVTRLRRWHIHLRQIGFEVGRPEWDDQQEILRYLHGAKRATFFTRDLGFFRSSYCHSNYGIVVITGSALETASLIRRLLRHPEFRTRANRCGKVVRLSSTRITWYELRRRGQQHLTW